MLNKYQIQELEKIVANPQLLKDVPEDLRTNREFLLLAIKRNSFVTAHVVPELLNDEDFALTAVLYNPNAYAFLPAKFKDNENITIMAVRQSPPLYFYASERLQADEDFKIKCLKTNSWYPLIKLNKVIKNNFYEGVKDTFKIMYGDYGIIEKLDGNVPHPNQLKHGLVDITMIPQLANFLLNYGLPHKTKIDNPFKYVKDDEKWKDAVILRTISCFLGLGLQCVRLGMAVAATAISLPIVALVHILKFPFVYYYERKLLKLEGEIFTENNTPVSEKTTLADFVAMTHSSLTDLCGYHGSDTTLTSYSAENTKESRYGSLRSSSPQLFFKPAPIDTPSQLEAEELMTALDINEKYNPNDAGAVAKGRSFS
ncbi:DUF4116 domain-containing protein [Fluoribacter dumoffii]|uniref:DUF4116 domain-containing protein n=1 Tax=Fluoribacter dumoffii TaxID=463 RepID=A0A377GEB4_9GAMM|nr:DUF4116 domain-containing protein [Fluoribacter dumoffii]KTC91214.1 hypothetical protein Ldum_2282 [Fluoribacter dumoffii NY 23]MCW8387618.1 DUF4116 domain-containing protein [Fluoribacter dumoffii]MCW8416837.1 DUF4116 domain-containing protein [Fluoribacter dumoffii]MCW8455323.1 DUF4116 domain-containing protein [Fluoribacter dumoffii]MCW8460599.1 DUF4116 domain-containing protein [Fluoribacter dumoffii]